TTVPVRFAIAPTRDAAGSAGALSDGSAISGMVTASGMEIGFSVRARAITGFTPTDRAASTWNRAERSVASMTAAAILALAMLPVEGAGVAEASSDVSRFAAGNARACRATA